MDPVTRKEKILSGDLTIEPVTREEQLLYALVAGGGGGGGGTTNYNVLTNKPKINGVELRGDKTSAELQIDTTLSAELKATKAVGGVPSGKVFDAGDSIESILRMMLNPTEPPTFVEPTANLTSNAARRIFGIDETIGSLVFNLAFNRGTISTGGYRAGAATSYTIDGQNGQTVTIDMDAKMQNGERQVTITGTVAYAKGDQPKDSSGADYGTPLAAGTKSAALTFERKPYIYSNKSGAFERMPISQYNASPTEIELANEDPPNEATIAFPTKATAIETWDALEKEWEDVSWEFLEEQITLDGRTYWKYTDNRGYRAGERKLRFTW